MSVPTRSRIHHLTAFARTASHVCSLVGSSAVLGAVVAASTAYDCGFSGHTSRDAAAVGSAFFSVATAFYALGPILPFRRKAPRTVSGAGPAL